MWWIVSPNSVGWRDLICSILVHHLSRIRFTKILLTRQSDQFYRLYNWRSQSSCDEGVAVVGDVTCGWRAVVNVLYSFAAMTFDTSARPAARPTVSLGGSMASRVCACCCCCLLLIRQYLLVNCSLLHSIHLAVVLAIVHKYLSSTDIVATPRIVCCKHLIDRPHFTWLLSAANNRLAHGKGATIKPLHPREPLLFLASFYTHILRPAT